MLPLALQEFKTYKKHLLRSQHNVRLALNPKKAMQGQLPDCPDPLCFAAFFATRPAAARKPLLTAFDILYALPAYVPSQCMQYREMHTLTHVL